VSIDYYARLERGKEVRPSPSVVEALRRLRCLKPSELRRLCVVLEPMGAKRQFYVLAVR